MADNNSAVKAKNPVIISVEDKLLFAASSFDTEIVQPLSTMQEDVNSKSNTLISDWEGSAAESFALAADCTCRALRDGKIRFTNVKKGLTSTSENRIALDEYASSSALGTKKASGKEKK